MLPYLLSVAALVALIGLALAMGKWMARDRDSTKPVSAGILGAIAVALMYFAINGLLLDINDLEFAPILIILEVTSLPIIAGLVARSYGSTEKVTGRRIAAAVVPVILLIVLLNPLTELLLACIFGRSIYMTQFFGFAGCG